MKFAMIVLGVSSSWDALKCAMALPFFLIVVSALNKRYWGIRTQIRANLESSPSVSLPSVLLVISTKELLSSPLRRPLMLLLRADLSSWKRTEFDNLELGRQNRKQKWLKQAADLALSRPCSWFRLGWAALGQASPFRAHVQCWAKAYYFVDSNHFSANVIGICTGLYRK